MAHVHSFVVIFTFILSIYCDNVIPQNPLESQVLLLLQKWRLGQVDSNIIPLPSLKSVTIPQVEHYYNQNGIKMTYKLNKMELTGLDTFSIKKLVASENNKNLEMSISMNIPKLTLYADKYEIKGLAYLLYPLKGSGNMTVVFWGSELTVKIRFGTIDGISTKVQNFLFDFNVNKIEANLVDSSWPINNVLNKDGVEIMASYHDDIVQALWDYVVSYVDKHLTSVTTAQIINIVLNTSL